jgi:hypothetical protein
LENLLAGKALNDMEAANKKVAVRVVSRYLKGSKYSDELQKGIEAEKEHSDVYDFLEKFLKKDKIEMPFTLDEFAAMIAKSHLKEMSDYYTRLAEMEGKFHKEDQPVTETSSGVSDGFNIMQNVVKNPQEIKKATEGKKYLLESLRILKEFIGDFEADMKASKEIDEELAKKRLYIVKKYMGELRTKIW